MRTFSLSLEHGSCGRASIAQFDDRAAADATSALALVGARLRGHVFTDASRNTGHHACVAIPSTVDSSLTLCKIMRMAKTRVPTLPPKEALILELLVEKREMYGLQLVAASKRRLKRGTVYVTLGRMEEKGFISSRLESRAPEEGGLPRRLYEATAFGRRVLSAYELAERHLAPEFAR